MVYSLEFSSLGCGKRGEGVVSPGIMRVAEIRKFQGKDTFMVNNSGLPLTVGVESRDIPTVGLAGASTPRSRLTLRVALDRCTKRLRLTGILPASAFSALATWVSIPRRVRRALSAL